jgi:hypothetical protein
MDSQFEYDSQYGSRVKHVFTNHNLYGLTYKQLIWTYLRELIGLAYDRTAICFQLISLNAP